MLTIVAAAVTSLEVIGCSKNHQALLINVIILGYKTPVVRELILLFIHINILCHLTTRKQSGDPKCFNEKFSDVPMIWMLIATIVCLYIIP